MTLDKLKSMTYEEIVAEYVRQEMCEPEIDRVLLEYIWKNPPTFEMGLQ